MRKFMPVLLIFVCVFVCSLLTDACSPRLAHAAGNPASPAETPRLMDTSISPSFTTAQVSVGATATLIKAQETAKDRYSITIRNIGSSPMYIGNSSSVTTSTGYPLNPYEAYTFDRNYGPVYGICGTGLSTTASYIEEAN